MTKLHGLRSTDTDKQQFLKEAEGLVINLVFCFQANEDQLKKLFENIETSVTNLHQSVKSFLYEGNEYR